MRRLTSILLAVGLVVCASALAKPKPKRFTPIALGGQTGGTNTMGVTGYVKAIYVSVSDGASTGNVVISYAPYVGGDAINIATNLVTDEKVFRPVVDSTTIAGVDLGSDPPTPYVLAGETVSLVVSGSPTNLTWSGVLIVEEAK